VLILGLETATISVGCAIGGHEGVLASFHAARGRRHVETLMPAVEFMCTHAQVDLSEISVVAVDIGPGLFSGLRVGVAAAKALAQALRVPTIGISSLDLLAFPVRHTNRLIVPAIDARRGELFYAFYRQVPGGAQRLSPYQLGTPADLASELLALGEDCLVVGDGALRYPDILTGVSGCEAGDPTSAFPSAASLVELAHPRALREEFVPPWELQPLYLRKSDAEINWDASISRATR
jgi:tRNA threonylcarbamoyladenosine biosynthesis protein TsaB